MSEIPRLKDKVLNCPILIATSNDFLPLLKPFAFLFNEFWSPRQKVTFLGYESPTFSLPKNFDFVSLGYQRGVKHWANDILPYIEKLNYDYFSYTAEDMFLAREVNFEALDLLLQKCRTLDTPPGRAALGDSVSMQNNIPCPQEQNFILQTSDSQYRLSLQWSLWRKDYFLKYLHPDYSQWDFEVKNMEIAKSDGENIVGLKENYPLGFCNASVTGGNTENLNFENTVFDFTDICSARDRSKRKKVEQEYITKMVDLGLISKENLK